MSYGAAADFGKEIKRLRTALETLYGMMGSIDWIDPDHMAYDGPLLEKIVREALDIPAVVSSCASQGDE